MKIILIIILSAILSAFLYVGSNNGIFTEDVIVKNMDGNYVNLKEIELTKDTVMIFIWCKTCGSCIWYLDQYKKMGKDKNYQILAIAYTKSDSIEKEKTIINKHKWPFEMYFDSYEKQNITKFFTKKGYCDKSKLTKAGNFSQFPRIFVFVKNKFICSDSCKYTMPF